MLADMKGEFAKAIDLELDATPLLGNVRCKRYEIWKHLLKITFAIPPARSGVFNKILSSERKEWR